MTPTAFVVVSQGLLRDRDQHLSWWASHPDEARRSSERDTVKLRIKGNSLRLRVSRSEVVRLIQDGHIEDAIHFAAHEEATLTDALAHAPSDRDISVEYRPQRITIWLSTNAAKQWSGSEQTGIYGEIDTGFGPLTLVVEKDFACLDRSKAENEDTFPNPKAGGTC